MNEIDDSTFSEVLSKPNNLNSIVEDAFAVADKNNNGSIDLEEFEICMKNVSDSFGLSTPDKKILNQNLKDLIWIKMELLILKNLKDL